MSNEQLGGTKLFNFLAPKAANKLKVFYTLTLKINNE